MSAPLDAPVAWRGPPPRHEMPSGGEPFDRRNWIAGLEHERLSATDAARLTGMTRSSARRHLMMLQHLGFVAGDGRQFWLQARVLRLGSAWFQSARFPRAVQPLLQWITAATRETAMAAVLDDEEVVFVARNGANRLMHTGFVQGVRLAPSLSSAGIAMLAALPPARGMQLLAAYEPRPHTPFTLVDKQEIAAVLDHARRRGYAVLQQQLEPGVRGIAVPLRNHRAEVVGAVSVSSRCADESEAAAVERIVPVLLQASGDFRFAQ